MTKGEIADYEQFLLLSQCFPKVICCEGLTKHPFSGKGYIITCYLLSRHLVFRLYDPLPPCDPVCRPSHVSPEHKTRPSFFGHLPNLHACSGLESDRLLKIARNLSNFSLKILATGLEWPVFAIASFKIQYLFVWIEFVENRKRQKIFYFDAFPHTCVF